MSRNDLTTATDPCSFDCPYVADLGNATGARLLEENLGEAPQNAVSEPHIGLQSLQHLQQLTLDLCDLEELSDRDVASAAGSAQGSASQFAVAWLTTNNARTREDERAMTDIVQSELDRWVASRVVRLQPPSGYRSA